jgi:xanthine dehydrogenase YagR molybdenum-binding subunit
MEFDQPAGHNPIDAGRVVTQPRNRVEGPLKVSGRAHYAYEYHAEAPNAAYGYMVVSGIGKGRITAIDTAAAQSAPGVLLVMTHLNAPRQGSEGEHHAPQLVGTDIKHAGQAVAFVVADSFEQARASANLVKVSYETTAGRFDLAAVKDSGTPPPPMMGRPADSHVGDFAAAFAAAPVSVDATYTTPDHSHTMMEPHASMAVWQGDMLTVYTSHQILRWAQQGVAETLMIPREKVRIVSAYVGGGFGSKLMIYADPILTALAARQLGRPVRMAVTRPQIFNHTSHRPATIQRVRLGAERDGKLTAIGHEVWCGNLPGGQAEMAALQTRLLYRGDNRMTAHRKTELDLPMGGSMRAPGEAVGLLALESAMDELAEKLGIDPVALRIANDIQYDPEQGPARPFSTRNLVGCLRAGAERFGWDRRNPRPAQVRDGDWLVGIGVASAIRDNIVQPSDALVRLETDGSITVKTAQTDIGTGSYTVLAQIAAEMMGLPIERVRVLLGDTDFPLGAGSGGSWGANSSGSGVFYACQVLRAKIAQQAGLNADDAMFADGRVAVGNRSRALVELAGSGGMQAEAGATFGDLTQRYAQAAFGAHFTEVGVDIHTGETRVRRMLSVVAAGRILNPKTARSQCLGGMTMGIGAALMEEQVVDTRLGYFVNHDMAEYQVPVHADIPALEVEFLAEEDDKSSPLKAKGIGELGICGVGASVANAVYNATGVRVRDFPLTLDKLIGSMPVAA